MHLFRSKTSHKVGLLFALLSTLVFTICGSTDTYASTKDTIVKKAGLYGLSQCYEAPTSAYKSQIPLSSFRSYLDIVQNSSAATVYLPNGFYKANSGTDINTVNCSSVLSGSASYPGVLGSHKPNAANLEQVKSFLTGMAYKDSNIDSGLCTKFYYNTSAGTRVWIQMCADSVTGSGNNAVINVDKMSVSYSSGTDNTVVQFETRNGSIQLDCNTNLPTHGACGSMESDHGSCTARGRCTFVKGQTKWVDFVNSIRDSLFAATGGANPIQSFGTTFTFDPNVEMNTDSIYVPYSDSGRANSIKAIQYLSNYAGVGSLELNEEEKAVLLQGYLENYYAVDSRGCFGDDGLTEAEISTAESSGYRRARVYVAQDDIFRVCLVKPTKNENNTVNSYNTTSSYFDGTQMGFSTIVDELNRLTVSALDNDNISGSLTGIPTRPSNPTGPNTPNGIDDGSDSSSITACYRNAGALGWLVCPVMEVVGKMTEGLYGYIEGNFLQVGTNLSNANGVREGWGIFRDFTNIIFTIMFLVVIISQVTGVGVSNYGIKKILPRLIVIVVMVNISFLLCQLAIDVSNILGSGLRSMFEGFATKIDSVPFNLGTVVGGITGAAFSATGTVAVLSALSLTIPWATWLFPIFLTILSCLVSVFFFMILLGVRQAGVIILMVLSPVAIICYALPNTKMFFDRWRKLFVSLLMVYPICGILMGGGQFASTLLLSVADDGAGGVFFTIVAMLVSVVPFFFIPSILKASMLAMGNLGMKISQFGRGIGGGITRGIRGSEIGRDIQRRANMRYADRAAAKIEKRAARLAKKNKDLSGWNRTRLGRYNATYNRLGYEDIRAGGSAERIKPGTSVYASMVENARDEQFSKEVQGKQNLIKNSGLDSVINAGSKVNGEDDAALSAELDEYLKRIINANALGYDDATVTEYVKSAQAIINTLSDRGTSGARTKVINSLSNALNANAATLMGAAGSERDRLRKTFGSLASRISDKYGKAYKGDYPGASAMLGDIAKGDFSAASTFRAAKDLDIDGNVTGSHLRSTQYTGAGLDGMNTEDFSKLKTSGLSNILAGIQDGDITGEKLQEMARLADEVLNSDIYTPDGDARKYMERIRDAAFASSSVLVSGGRTAGSAVISRANSRAISSILNQVQAAADWSHLNADQQQHFGHLMSNIHESLANDSFTAGDAGQLKQTLKIGRAKNFEDASTGTIVGEFAGAPTLKITHADGGRQKVSLPAGWARDPGGRWIEVTSSGMRPLNAAEIKKAEQIEAHNNQVDIDNGTV